MRKRFACNNKNILYDQANVLCATACHQAYHLLGIWCMRKSLDVSMKKKGDVWREMENGWRSAYDGGSISPCVDNGLRYFTGQPYNRNVTLHTQGMKTLKTQRQAWQPDCNSETAKKQGSRGKTGGLDLLAWPAGLDIEILLYQGVQHHINTESRRVWLSITVTNFARSHEKEAVFMTDYLPPHYPAFT